MMKTRYGILICLALLSLLSSVGMAAAAPAGLAETQNASADTLAYDGQIGPGNSLYGLRIAFENLDESFTFNQSEKISKQVNHAGFRLSELKQALAENSTAAAEIALEQYRQKLNQTEETLVPFFRNSTGPQFAGNDTGLSHAQEMITKHQQVLAALLESHPDNQGLARAYNNSLTLEQKFAMKLEARHRNRGDGDNSTFVPPEEVNQTMNGFGRNGNRPADNSTGQFPRDLNQSGNRYGQNRDGPSGNSVIDIPRTNKSEKQNGNGPDGQADNQTQGNSPENGRNQNDKGNAGNSENTDSNRITNNGNSNSNTLNPGKGAGNTNDNTGTGNTNNRGNSGSMAGGNSPGSGRSPGR